MLINDNFETKKLYSNNEFKLLRGHLEEGVAKKTLAQFLYNNLGVTVKLLLGLELLPFQEVILRNWFDHNFNYFVASRGGSKSYLTAVFCSIYPIFHPDTRIVLTSNSFRATRRIIVQIEKFINGKEAGLLKQCYYAKKGKLEFQRRNDEMILEINGGAIISVPLNEKIRGTRGEILICDEFAQIPELLYKEVLMPFLLAKNDIQEQLKMGYINEALENVTGHELSDEDKIITQSNKKIIALTSASYDFEFAYRLYMDWVKKCEEAKHDKGSTYFIARMSYKALPEKLIDQEIVEEAKSGGENNASFQREYMAMFSSSSDGFFNIKKLHDCTVPNGDLPCVQLKGNKDSKYLITIDPSFGASKSSDLFSIAVYLLNSDNRTITLINSYGVAGGNLSDHLKYLAYLIKNFNIVMIGGDFGGANFDFIQVANESVIFQESNIKLDFIEGDFDSDNYIQEMKKAKNSYNLTEKRICRRQIFNSEWLRKANEFLQSSIDKNKVWFASKLCGHSTLFEKAISDYIPIVFKDINDFNNRILDFIAEQDNLIDQAKAQLALIEVKTTSQGTMQFDLPQHLRRSKSPDRARRDLYTTLLMANWFAKCYWDMIYSEDDEQQNVFMPRLI